MKRSDIEVGGEYAAGRYGSCEEDKRRAILVRITGGGEKRSRGYGQPLFLWPCLVLDGDGTECIWLESRQIFRDAAAEREHRAARKAAGARMDAARSEALALATELGGTIRSRVGAFEIVLPVEQAKRLVDERAARP